MLQETAQTTTGSANGTHGRVNDGALLAAVYVRVSTSDQADKGYSLPSQIEGCLALAKREGYTVPEKYIFSEDYTGTSLNRPELHNVRELVQQGLIRTVIVYDYDRLARKLAHQLLLTDECEQHGVLLRTVTMPAGEQTPETQLLTNVRGIIAEYERAKILERTERGRRGGAKQGFVPGGKRSLGYDYVKSGDKGAIYEINPEEATLVRRIFRMYVENHQSLYEIAKRLTQEGIPTQRDRRINGPRRKLSPCVWHPGTLLAILRNETYTGVMYYGKTERLPGKSNPDKKTRWRQKPKEEWIAISVPQIIDQATFDAAQSRRATNAQQSKRNRKHEYLLCNQRLRCGVCGRVMTGQFKPSRECRFYRCNGHSYLIRHPCKSRIGAAKIENAVWDAVEKVLRNPALIAEELERRRQGSAGRQSDIERERQLFNKQIARCDKELHKWEQAYLHDVIDVQELKERKADVMKRRGSVERELARLNEQEEAIEKAELETTLLSEYCNRVYNNLQRLDTAEKRLALDALNITVYWQPDKPLDIRGSIPVCIESNAPRCMQRPCRAVVSAAHGQWPCQFGRGQHDITSGLKRFGTRQVFTALCSKSRSRRLATGWGCQGQASHIGNDVPYLGWH